MTFHNLQIYQDIVDTNEIKELLAELIHLIDEDNLK